MLVPMRWLREYVTTDLSTEEIAHRLTMAGLEAESVTHIGDEWNNVYVGRVEEVEKHPDADRLVLATVAAGEHRSTVVTGAPNIRPGQTVALALVGARLIDGQTDDVRWMTLKSSTIRGVRSEGMVCSEKELGISEEHEGIMVLPSDAPVGAPLREYLGDDVIEFEITPNLVHAFSVIGIARELAAVVNASARAVLGADLATTPMDDTLVDIEDEDLCARYTLAIIENVTVGPSPEWMQRRLTAAGMRSVNNIVDISNYVMAEVGQPTHPFDADRLSGGRIIVRRAKPGESMVTIDHVERVLDEGMLVISDAEGAIGLAGVMGGVDSEVTDGTTRVLLESASFDPKTTRRTSRALKLASEASARYQRGVDPNLAWTALERFVALLREIDPAAKVTAVADAYPRPRGRSTVRMPYNEIERLLGMIVPMETVLDILGRLEFEVTVEDAVLGPLLVVSAPTYRSDINLPADVVEEVARIYGYDSLPERLPTGGAAPIRREPARLVDRVAQDALIVSGLQQVITYSMIADADLVALSPNRDHVPDLLGGYPRPESDYVRAVNPLRADWEIMRPTMLPSLLKIVAENLKYTDRVAIFETARTYQPVSLDELPEERRGAALALCGARHPVSWSVAERSELDFFDAKGTVETLLARVGASASSFTAVEHPSFHPGRCAAVSADGVQIGIVGEIHPRVAANFGVAHRVAMAELDLEGFASTLLATWRVKPVSRFQPIRQDFAVLVDQGVAVVDVREAIAAGGGPLITAVEPFDVYQGEGIPEGKKSLAFSVTMSAPDRQLAEHEVDRIRGKIEQNVRKRVGGTLRA
ncbi:MAG TPA: phenylalanine--tRNA ligase subunit beta [Thermomicrobiales bacterium]|nr:phenylalanine--tRNA ligase subunit beta [Thermomicrobiales bacterium]